MSLISPHVSKFAQANYMQTPILTSIYLIEDVSKFILKDHLKICISIYSVFSTLFLHLLKCFFLIFAPFLSYLVRLGVML